MTDIAIFVTLHCSNYGKVAVADRVEFATQLQFLKSFIDIASVETYVPEQSELNDREAVSPPVLIIQINMADAAAATTLTGSDLFADTLSRPDAYPFPVDSIIVELTEVVQYPIHGKSTALPRTAPTSYVVRYYGPVEDAAEFARFYTDNHPPILSRFKGLRNLLCYLPLGWESVETISDERMIIGNEVVFENQQSLLDALATDVLVEAREDGKKFQSFGYSTHHLMHRERVFDRAVEEPANV